MKFYKFLILAVLLSLFFSGLLCGKKQIQRSQEDVIYLNFNIFVFEATQAEEKLEFTPFPIIIPTQVIDQVFRDAEQLFESLKSLSSFNRLLLLTSFTQRMKLSNTMPLKTEAVQRSYSTVESGYEVEVMPRLLEQERVQLRVAVQKGGELFFTTDVSAPIDKSVVIGRIMEQTQKALLVTFSVEEETDSSVMVSLDNAEPVFAAELTEPIIMESKPVPLEITDPIYPESARKDKIEGIVWLRVLVDENGEVAEVVVIKSLREDFDQAAVENAWKFRHTPAISQGKPVPVWMLYSITFKLF